MSVLSKIFKRKPGGTFVGNLIRNQVKTLSGGLLGNGAMLLKEDNKTVEPGALLPQHNESIIEKSKQALDSQINTTKDTIVDFHLDTTNPKPTIPTEIKPQSWMIIGGVILALYMLSKK